MTPTWRLHHPTGVAAPATWLAVVTTLTLFGCVSGPPVAPHDRAATFSPCVVEPLGAQGTAGNGGATGWPMPDRLWRPHTDYLFSPNGRSILRTDASKTQSIAGYMHQTPSAHLGLDGADTTRVALVRDALIAAGVPPERIFIGPFGETRQRRDTRVLVLVDR